MATKHIISPGIGFSPGSVKYIITRGLISTPTAAIIDLTLKDRSITLTLKTRVITLTLEDR